MKNYEPLIKILIPLLGIAVAWGVITTRINNFEVRITKLEQEIEKLDETFLKIEVRLAEIQKDIQSINSKL